MNTRYMLSVLSACAAILVGITAGGSSLALGSTTPPPNPDGSKLVTDTSNHSTNLTTFYGKIGGFNGDLNKFKTDVLSYILVRPDLVTRLSTLVTTSGGVLTDANNLNNSAFNIKLGMGNLQTAIVNQNNYLVSLTAERDGLVSQVNTLTGAADWLNQQVNVLRSELDAANYYLYFNNGGAANPAMSLGVSQLNTGATYQNWNVVLVKGDKTSTNPFIKFGIRVKDQIGMAMIEALLLDYFSKKTGNGNYADFLSNGMQSALFRSYVYISHNLFGLGSFVFGNFSDETLFMLKKYLYFAAQCSKPSSMASKINELIPPNWIDPVLQPLYDAAAGGSNLWPDEDAPLM